MSDITYLQLQRLCEHIRDSTEKGPPPGMDMLIHPKTVVGIQTGALLAVQLVALLAARAAGCSPEKAQADFGIPDYIIERANAGLIQKINQIADTAAEDPPSGKINELFKTISDREILNKFVAFTTCVTQACKAAYLEHDDAEKKGEPLDATTPEQAFRDGMDFMAGAVAIGMKEVSTMDIDRIARLLGMPEKARRDLATSMENEDESV